MSRSGERFEGHELVTGRKVLERGRPITAGDVAEKAGMCGKRAGFLLAHFARQGLVRKAETVHDVQIWEPISAAPVKQAPKPKPVFAPYFSQFHPDEAEAARVMHEYFRVKPKGRERKSIAGSPALTDTRKSILRYLDGGAIGGRDGINATGIRPRQWASDLGCLVSAGYVQKVSDGYDGSNRRGYARPAYETTPEGLAALESAE